MRLNRQLLATRLIFCVLLAFGGFPLRALSAETVEAARVRPAQVASEFYPDDEKELRSLIQELLKRQPEPAKRRKPRVLIVPHAGYQYSGLIAANAYRQLQGTHYDGVVVVGFTHRAQFPGSSVDTREAYATPLGEIPVNQEAAAVLRTYPGIGFVESAHASNEHSLEVQLPFLQQVLGRFRLVPVLMGSVDLADAEHLATALKALSRLGDYLFVFSTDLSHYHSYDDANRLDERTIKAILQESPQGISRLFDSNQVEACGRGPIEASLFLAGKLGYLRRELLYHANSGDTWGPATKVVGYAAIAMYDAGAAKPQQKRLSQAAGKALVKAARRSLERAIADSKAAPVNLNAWPELNQARGVFVTLRKQGQLRGCIGQIRPSGALAKMVPAVARDAALRDSRFNPVTAQELAGVRIEVSVLTPPVEINDPGEIVPGRDGVILESNGHSGVFLPQVWDETKWTRIEFLRELASQKAGLSPDAWQHATLYTFQAQAFEE